MNEFIFIHSIVVVVNVVSNMSLQISPEPSDELKLRQNSKLLRDVTKEVHFSAIEVDALAVIYFKFLNENDIKRTQMDRQQFRNIFHTVFLINDDILIDRSFIYLDKGTSVHVTLDTWIRTMSLFLRGTLEEKMKYCYAVYDLNNDGKIKRNEVILLLGKCFIMEYEEDVDLAVKDLADILVRKMDVDGDGVISFDDYKKSVLDQNELLECFGQCLPDRACAYSFMRTFTSENLRF